MTDNRNARSHFVEDACIFVYNTKIPRKLFADAKLVASPPECKYGFSLSILCAMACYEYGKFLTATALFYYTPLYLLRRYQL